jgi:hypothetical protein
MNRADFCVPVLKGLVSVTGRIQALPIGSCYGAHNFAKHNRAGM